MKMLPSREGATSSHGHNPDNPDLSIIGRLWNLVSGLFINVWMSLQRICNLMQNVCKNWTNVQISVWQNSSWNGRKLCGILLTRDHSDLIKTKHPLTLESEKFLLNDCVCWKMRMGWNIERKTSSFAKLLFHQNSTHHHLSSVYFSHDGEML